MAPRLSRSIWLLTLLARCGPVHAQEPDPARELELIESTELGEDPLGIDDSTGRALEQAAERLPKSTAVLPTAERGEVLSAIALVRESAHTVDVRLGQGLAFVSVSLALRSTAKHAAEVAYRLPLPRGGVLTRFRACVGGRCSQAAPASDGASLARAERAAVHLSATPIQAPAGEALALRISPIAPDATATIELEYVAEAPVRGGHARFTLPARGYDPNVSPALVRLHSSPELSIANAPERQVEPWSSLTVKAGLNRPVTSVVTAPCGASPCVRRYEARPLAVAESRSTSLLIDASPSMEGPARSRLTVALAALLQVLPEQTPLHVLAFAAAHRELGRFRAGEAPLQQLVDASFSELGAATQPSAALLADASPGKGARIIVVSDGLFDVTARERAALRAAQQRGAELWLVALGDAEPRLVEAFDAVLPVSELAERALHDGPPDALEDALRVLAQPKSRGGLRAGEQRLSERGSARPTSLSAGSPWLTFWQARIHGSQRWSSHPAEPAPGAIPAVPYLTEPPLAKTSPTGLPKESVLSMLRTQLVPEARACLRTDRRGRADYAVGVTFHALFAQREVYGARIEGSLAKPLRSCLERVLQKLRVPAFSGSIRVRYPIHTEREQEQPMIELAPEVEQQLERALSGPRALP